MNFEEELCEEFEPLLNFNLVLKIEELKEKHCLDKVKVKEAFMDLLGEWVDRGGDINDNHLDRIHPKIIYDKMKELGL